MSLPQHVNDTHTKLVVVTATTSAERFGTFAEELFMHAHGSPPIVVISQQQAWKLTLRQGVVEYGEEYLGVIPAFARGVQLALRTYPNAEVIACLHDDLLLLEPAWDTRLVDHFTTHPNCGLAGFGGAWGLGDESAGQGDYRPTWLVRRGFMSNMQDAEAHGTRVTEARPVACLDGFSQVFRRNFLIGWANRTEEDFGRVLRRVPGVQESPDFLPTVPDRVNLFRQMQLWGLMHHAYDAATGALAKQLGWDTWLLPYHCHHLGGQTAVGDAGYNEWARRHAPNLRDSTAVGDQVFWEQAHKIVWAKFGHLLPFEVDRP